jgi:hypothetical protein
MLLINRIGVDNIASIDDTIFIMRIPYLRGSSSFSFASYASAASTPPLSVRHMRAEATKQKCMKYTKFANWPWNHLAKR